MFFFSFSLAGNLALSRALGDFCFKKNDKKSAEEQIVTGRSNCILYIIIHAGHQAHEPVSGRWFSLKLFS